MSDAALLEIIRRLPPEKAQEIYDFATFLYNAYRVELPESEKIDGFASEDEMISYINDIGRIVYAG
ncbi:MAG: DUF2281 domain-containing protein [Coriobacteriales bacterium]|jgi:hypothetical protein|nr:DUF2281 domain-containing protein [Coriobacteriales bacterium]